MKPKEGIPESDSGLISWKRSLLTVPVRNQSAVVERTADKTVRVQVEKKKPWYLVPPLSWAIAPRLKTTVVMDRLGTSVWELCDGKRNVEGIVDCFAETYRLTFHEARAAVTGYLRSLVQRGVLAVAEFRQREGVHTAENPPQ